MLDTLHHYSMLLRDRVDWQITILLAVIVLIAAYSLKLRDPRHLERAMARKMERRKVADIISAALQDACVAGQISPDVRYKYNKKLAVSLELPDMMPGKFDLNKAKQLCRQRLNVMGVNLAEGLRKLRKEKPVSKKAKLKAALKKST
jgi:hypothetical protein